VNNIRTYDEFLNEEYGFKSAIGGILLAIMTILPNLSNATKNQTRWGNFYNPPTTGGVYSPSYQLKTTNVTLHKSLDELIVMMEELVEKIDKNSWDDETENHIYHLIYDLNDLHKKYLEDKNVDKEIRDVTEQLSFIVGNFRENISPSIQKIVDNLQKPETYDSRTLVLDYNILYNEIMLIGQQYGIDRDKMRYLHDSDPVTNTPNVDTVQAKIDALKKEVEKNKVATKPVAIQKEPSGLFHKGSSVGEITSDVILCVLIIALFLAVFFFARHLWID
jgi:hypothetical protein